MKSTEKYRKSHKLRRLCGLCQKLMSMLVNKLVNKIKIPSIKSIRVLQFHWEKPFAIARQKVCITEDGVKVDHLDRTLAIFILLTLQFPHSCLLVMFRIVIWMNKPSDKDTWNFLTTMIRIKVGKEKPHSGNQEPTHSLCIIANRDKNSVEAR